MMISNRLQPLRPVTLRQPEHILFRRWVSLYRTRFPYQELAPVSMIEQSIRSGNNVIQGWVNTQKSQWVAFTLLEFYPTGTLLAYLATHPNYERQGLAKILVDQQLEHYLTKQMPFFWLEANPKLWAFYQKLGFYRLPIPYYIPEYSGEGVEQMGLFVKHHSSVSAISKEQLIEFVSQLFLSGYGLTKEDIRYQEQMKRIQAMSCSEFEFDSKY